MSTSFYSDSVTAPTATTNLFSTYATDVYQPITRVYITGEASFGSDVVAGPHGLRKH